MTSVACRATLLGMLIVRQMIAAIVVAVCAVAVGYATMGLWSWLGFFAG